MRPHCTQTVSPPLRGLSLARERECVLTWDGQDGLSLFDRGGRTQARGSSPLPVAAASIAEDGSVCAIGSARTPAVCLLAPDLTPRWRHPLPRPVTALALQPLGHYLAVADADCTLRLLNRRGQQVWQAMTPRPLCHLAFVPEKPLLIGTADFGLVVCFNSAGECLWRDGLVAHIGSLAVSGDGECVQLACFGDGLYRYSAAGSRPRRLPLEAACHVAALSYSGEVLLTADRGPCVVRRDADGKLRDSFHADGPVVALALGAQGDYGVVGLADGSVLWMDMP